ncbi:adenylate cyclase [Novosphingobium percolationis]|uniref:adenylate cyclase n=1 Tax=Novosphingobium percolationis TaxID=2871811 RepID=UPI001CD28C05|nr:adenylate cyclase [Novosphingobium percolationis]
MATAAPLPPFDSSRPAARERDFHVRMATGLGLFVIFAFGQFALRGLSHPATAPWWVHAHGLLMLGWMGLFVVQTRLGRSRSMELHRTLGWAACALVAAIAVAAVNAAYMAVAMGRVPPFFTNPYFVALTWMDIAGFVAVFVAAVLARGNAPWHRRLMLASVVLVTEPAFGRLVPLPLLGAAGPWVERAFQIAVFAFPLRHDLRTIGRVHPATLVGPAVIVAEQAAILALAAYAPFAVHVEAIAAR